MSSRYSEGTTSAAISPTPKASRIVPSGFMNRRDHALAGVVNRVAPPSIFRLAFCVELTIIRAALSVNSLTRIRGADVLQKLGDHIKNCLERSEHCTAAAATSSDAGVRTQLLDLALQWQHVAKSYEFIESLERFLIDQQNHSLPKEVEKLPKDRPTE